MTEQEAYQKLKARLSSREWRLYNLYFIINKQGKKAKFIPNTFQRETLIDRLWFLNVILKARQLGMSTGIDIFILDMCLFNSNTNGGIIDSTLDDAKNKLDKCRFAYNNLPQQLKDAIQLVKDNETELVFSNGSRITADTSYRGSTLQVLHISELAKIAHKDPLKAREIRTGALNSIAPGQYVFIESTAEDPEGDFYEIVQRAEKLSLLNGELTKLDYRFFFFPWWQDETYSLSKPITYQFSSESTKYFNNLQAMGIDLTDDQKFWYSKKKEEQDEDMKKEYPSTSKEAFMVSLDDKYYHDLILQAYGEHRISEFEVDKGIDIDITLDLGKEDYTSVGFTQEVGKEIRFIDFLEINKVDVPEIVGAINEKKHKIRYMYLPHDAFATRLGMGGRDLATQFKEYKFDIKPVPVPTQVSVEAGISLVRKYLGRMWFKASTTGELLDHLQKYSKKWSEAAGIYVGPKHNEHSHAADMVRYVAARYTEPKPQEEFKAVPFSYKPQGGYR